MFALPGDFVIGLTAAESRVWHVPARLANRLAELQNPRGPAMTMIMRQWMHDFHGKFAP